MKMKSLTILALVGLVAALTATTAAAQDRPNVVLMLADNVGWGDIGAYGGGGLLRDTAASWRWPMLKMCGWGRCRPPFLLLSCCCPGFAFLASASAASLPPKAHQRWSSSRAGRCC